MPIGQEVTFVNPEHSTLRWLGFQGAVKDNPFYDICRSQQDVAIQGAWKKLLSEARDSHWVMAYGDWLKELGYAARKIGVEWSTLASHESGAASNQRVRVRFPPPAVAFGLTAARWTPPA